MSVINRLLEPTADDLADVRAGICDPTDPDETSDSILATASGWMSGLIDQLRDAVVEGDRDTMIRLVRKMTAADRVVDEVLTSSCGAGEPADKPSVLLARQIAEHLDLCGSSTPCTNALTERATTEGWHLDGHRLDLTLNGDAGGGWISLAVHCAADDRTPTADDPCRVDHDEDGTATGKIADCCNFALWLEAGSDPLESIYERVGRWQIVSFPLDIAVRWEGGGYEWAPREWVLAQTGGVR